MDRNHGDEFGKLFIELVRDTAIMFSNVTIRNAIVGNGSSLVYKSLIENLTEQDVELLQRLAIDIVDTTLHQLLLFFEGRDEFKIMLQSPDGLTNLKEFLLGDLQGYIFIWGEKYSKYPIDS